MAQFFFDRHNGSSTVEPFSEYKYSKQDYYYKTASSKCDTGSTTTDINTNESSYNPQSSRCGKDTYPSTESSSFAVGTDEYNNDQNTKRNMINNCLCKYKKNVDTYLEKTNSNMTINGTTNDNTEKYSNMAIKNINLGIGIGMMMFYIYVTNQ